MNKSISLDNLSFIDLTHTLTPEIAHWGVDCGFQHSIELDYPDCTTDVKFRIQNFQMAAGIGTHMDAPAHCIPGSSSISDIPLQSLIAPCRVINVFEKMHPEYRVSLDDIKSFESRNGAIPKGSFVIIYTGWSQRWSNPAKYRNNLVFPSVSKQAAEELLSRDIVGLGIDTLSPDTGNSDFPVHQATLSAGKYIIENIANADQLDATGNYIIALPIKVQNGTEAPVRLIGVKSNFA